MSAACVGITEVSIVGLLLGAREGLNIMFGFLVGAIVGLTV